MVPADAEKDDPQDLLLLDALSEGLSYSRAAEVARCSKMTVVRRMRVEAFRERVMAARSSVCEEALSALEGLSRRAVERLGEIVESQNDMAAVKAAQLVIDRAQGQLQGRATDHRLALLEQAVTELLDRQRHDLRSAA